MKKKMIKAQREQVKEEMRQDAASGRKMTGDGYKVYSLDELGVGKGGDTDLCPFDCECCF